MAYFKRAGGLTWATVERTPRRARPRRARGRRPRGGRTCPRCARGSYVYTSGQLPMRRRRAAGHRQGRRRGHARGGERVRPAVRAQRDRGGHVAAVGDLDARRARRQGRPCSSPARPTSPASPPSSTAPASCWRAVFGDAGVARAQRGRRRRAAARRARSRSSSSSRWPMIVLVPVPPSLAGARSPSSTRTDVAAPKDAATIVRGPRRRGRPRGVPHAPAALDGVRAPGMYVFPGGGVRTTTASRRRRGWARPPRGVGRPVRAATPRPARSPGRAPPCARPSRRPASCWPVPTSDSVVADTSVPTWQAAREALEAKQLAFARLPRRRALVLRADLLGGLGALDHPGASSRGATTPGSSSPRCREGQRDRHAQPARPTTRRGCR